MRISTANRALRRTGLVMGALAIVGAGSLASAQGASVHRPTSVCIRCSPRGSPIRGETLIAFKTPVSVAGNQFVANRAGGRRGRPRRAQPDALRASARPASSSCSPTFPADQLNAARARAEAATGRYVTDFTQVYRVTYNPAVNAGAAANALAQSPLRELRDARLEVHGPA